MTNRHYRMSNCERIQLPAVPLTNPLDRWMISEVHTLTAKLIDAYARYDLQTAARELLQFLDNLTNWYIRRSRRRFWKSENDGDKLAAYDTLYITLVSFCKLAAPIIPFITEEIYRGLTGEESVHLTMYPEFDRFRIDQKIASDMKTTQELITLGLALRARKKLRVRQPLASMTISEALPKYYQDILLEELNIHTLHQGTDMTAVARKICKPNARLIGPRFGKRVQEIIIAAKNGEFTLLEDGRVEVLNEILEISEFELVYESVSVDSDVEGGGGRIVMMDTVVTDDLLLEGFARDIVRTIQELRKEADFAVNERIEISIV